MNVGGSLPPNLNKKQCQVVVHGLPYAVSVPQLIEQFKEVGNVLQAKIFQDDQGRSRGWGTVLFDSPQGAQDAIDRFNGFEMMGRVLSVKPDEKA